MPQPPVDVEGEEGEEAVGVAAAAAGVVARMFRSFVARICRRRCWGSRRLG